MTPIVSETGAATDTRFGNAHDFMREMQRICDKRPIDSIRAAEPIGPRKLLDVLVICPCTGNTLAKLAAGITDSSVTMAAKAHLRNGRPLVVAVSTNDGLASSAKNIGVLLDKKNVYLVPFRAGRPGEEAHLAGGRLCPGARRHRRRPAGRTAPAGAAGAQGGNINAARSLFRTACMQHCP